VSSPVPRPRAPRLISPAKADATTPPPLEGDWAAHDRRLDAVQRYRLPSGTGPEDVVVDLEGRLVTGGDDGRIWRWPERRTESPVEPQMLADTGGRPLGIEIDPRDGSLIVCDAYRGLLRVDEDGAVTPLADTAGGTPILFCNNASVARDGTVYFTDSSHRFPLHAWRKDLLEYRPNGRVLAWSPSGAVEVVATGLYFPNGVALTPDEDALLVCETSSHRLVRVTLATGSVEPLADLPAYPDNMSSVGDGTYWIALASPRVPIVERLLPHPAVRRIAALLPTALQPKPIRYGLVALVDGDGTVLRTLHGPSGSYHMVTGVRQHAGSLWLGSLTERDVARVSLL